MVVCTLHDAGFFYAKSKPLFGNLNLSFFCKTNTAQEEVELSSRTRDSAKKRTFFWVRVHNLAELPSEERGGYSLCQRLFNSVGNLDGEFLEIS